MKINLLSLIPLLITLTIYIRYLIYCYNIKFEDGDSDE